MIDLKPHIHYDYELEASILGICLIESDAFMKIRPYVQPEHFYKPEHEALYGLMADMWSDGYAIDLVTVNIQVHRRGLQNKFTDTPAFYLACLTRDVITSAHLEKWSLLLREMYAEREIIAIQSEAGKGDGDAIDRMLEVKKRIEKALSVKAGDDWVDMGQAVLELQRHMAEVKGKDLLGLSTGFPTLDKITYGLQGGQLIVVGARPSVGKSAFAAVIAKNIAEKGNATGVIMLEMPKKQITARIASLHSDTEFWRIYRSKFNDQDQEDRINHHFVNLATLPIFISDKTNVTGSDIRAKATKLQKRKNLKALIIDYLQLIEAEGKSSDNREREIAKLSRSLKLMAMELEIPVILLCQLNRESEKSGNKEPKMSNIRESGAIEQDADVVILLHRDWKSGIERDADGNSTERQATIIVDKNRNGECLRIPISFDPETMKFYEEPTFKNPPHATNYAPPDNPRTGIYRDPTAPNKIDWNEP